MALYNLLSDYDAVMQGNNAAVTLAAMRLVVGVAAWVAPGVVGKIAGLDGSNYGESRYLWRIFGVRDAVLGAGVLATDGKSRKAWLKAGIVCDTFDTGSSVIGGKSGALPKKTAAFLTLPAVVGTCLGLAAHKLEDE